MDYTTLRDRAQALAEEVIATGAQHPAEALGLDQRCGPVWASTTWIATELPRNLNYYGGFEYIEADLVSVLGSWTFYSRASDRVDDALSRLDSAQIDDPVMARLMWYAEGQLTWEDRVLLDQEISCLKDRGWSNDRIFRLLKNHECVDPTLPEGLALALMAKVRGEPS